MDACTHFLPDLHKAPGHGEEPSELTPSLNALIRAALREWQDFGKRLIDAVVDLYRQWKGRRGQQEHSDLNRVLKSHSTRFRLRMTGLLDSPEELEQALQ